MNRRLVASGWSLKSYDPANLKTQQAQALLLGGVAPRPIALVSTVSPSGAVNLSPFSFFNAFGANPPTIVFSASRRIRDNTTKHTYENLKKSRECVVQAVTYQMVRQVSLASTEYEEGVDEFVKSGLTPLASEIVSPPRVAESPFQMECRLAEMMPLGERHGSGNLAVCEVLRFHVADEVMENGMIQPDMIDLVARMGGDFYARASGQAIFSVRKPGAAHGMGYDALPGFIKQSHILSANNLAQLAGVENIPELDAKFAGDSMTADAIDDAAFKRYESEGDYASMFQAAHGLASSISMEPWEMMNLAARRALDYDDVDFAWQALLHAQRQRGLTS